MFSAIVSNSSFERRGRKNSHANLMISVKVYYVVDLLDTDPKFIAMRGQLVEC